MMSMKDLLNKMSQLEALPAPKARQVLNESSPAPVATTTSKRSLKAVFNELSESIPAGARPLPVMDPTNKKTGMGFVTSTNPAVQNMLKNLDPKDVQIVQAPGQSNQQTQQTGQSLQPIQASNQPNQAMQEDDDLVEYGDPTSYEAGRSADAEENAEAEVFHDFEKGGAEAFVAEKFPEFNQPCDQEEALSTSEVQGELNAYLGAQVAELLDRDYYDLDDEMVKDLLPDVIKIAERNGWTFDAPINEGSKPSVKARLAASDINVLKNYGVPGNKMNRAMAHVRSGYSHEKAAKMVKDETLDEGAKVDRMVKHIEKSEKKSGKSKGEAQDIAWATANKRGMLDNKNKKKTNEADIPSTQGIDTMGAGLGAGRSATTLEAKSKPDFLDLDKDGNKKESMKKASSDKKKKAVKENMNNRIQAARLEGKAHGLKGHAHNGKHYEDMEESRAYHEGYKEGLDECYGMDPVRSRVRPRMPASTRSMARDPLNNLNTPLDEMIDEMVDEADSSRGPYRVVPAKGNYMGNRYDVVDANGRVVMTGQDETQARASADFKNNNKPGIRHEFPDLTKEGNAFTGALARTPKGGKFSMGGRSYTDTSKLGEGDFAFEAWDRKLNSLINEGLSVSISKGNQNAPDSVNVNATDAEADMLLSLVKQAGMGIFGGDDGADYGSPEVGGASEINSPGGIEVVDDHDGMLGLMKKLSGIEGTNADYEEEDCGCDDEEEKIAEARCDECGMMESKCGGHEKPLDEVESPDQMAAKVAEGGAQNPPDSGAHNSSNDMQGNAAANSALANADAGQDIEEEKDDDSWIWMDREEAEHSDEPAFMRKERKIKAYYDNMNAETGGPAGRWVKDEPKEKENDMKDPKEEDVKESFTNLYKKLAMLSEEAEQLDELSPKKLQQAAKKATDPSRQYQAPKGAKFLSGKTYVLRRGQKVIRITTPADAVKHLNLDDKVAPHEDLGKPSAQMQDPKLVKDIPELATVINARDKVGSVNKGMQDKFNQGAEKKIAKGLETPPSSWSPAQKRKFDKPDQPSDKKEKVDEWANQVGKGPGKGTDASFQQSIDFMVNDISGGLNKRKSTGQTTVPVVASQLDRLASRNTISINENIQSHIKSLGAGRMADDGKRHDEIDNHHLYDDLTSKVSQMEDEDAGARYLTLSGEANDIALRIASDTGFSAFSIIRYCSSRNVFNRWFFRESASDENLNEIFGFGRQKMSKEFPNNPYSVYADDGKSPRGKVDKLENHPLFDKLVWMSDDDNRDRFSQKQTVALANQIGQELGLATFFVSNYANQGPYDWRFGVGNSFKGPDLDESASDENLNEFLGPFRKKTQAQLYPENPYASANQNSSGKESYNFSKKMPKLEAHPLFDRLVDMCEEDSGYSQKQQYEVAKQIARDLDYGALQVLQYAGVGPWDWRFGVGNSFKGPNLDESISEMRRLAGVNEADDGDGIPGVDAVSIAAKAAAAKGVAAPSAEEIAQKASEIKQLFDFLDAKGQIAPEFSKTGNSKTGNPEALDESLRYEIDKAKRKFIEIATWFGAFLLIAPVAAEVLGISIPSALFYPWNMLTGEPAPDQPGYTGTAFPLRGRQPVFDTYESRDDLNEIRRLSGLSEDDGDGIPGVDLVSIAAKAAADKGIHAPSAEEIKANLDDFRKSYAILKANGQEPVDESLDKLTRDAERMFWNAAKFLGVYQLVVSPVASYLGIPHPDLAYIAYDAMAMLTPPSVPNFYDY